MAVSETRLKFVRASHIQIHLSCSENGRIDCFTKLFTKFLNDMHTHFLLETSSNNGRCVDVFGGAVHPKNFEVVAGKIERLKLDGVVVT